MIPDCFAITYICIYIYTYVYSRKCQESKVIAQDDTSDHEDIWARKIQDTPITKD